MNEKELSKIAVRMIEKGYIDHDKIRYCDDLYSSTKDEVNQCLDYVDEALEIGLTQFKNIHGVIQ